MTEGKFPDGLHSIEFRFKPESGLAQNILDLMASNPIRFVPVPAQNGVAYAVREPVKTDEGTTYSDIGRIMVSKDNSWAVASGLDYETYDTLYRLVMGRKLQQIKPITIT